MIGISSIHSEGWLKDNKHSKGCENYYPSCNNINIDRTDLKTFNALSVSIDMV